MKFRVLSEEEKTCQVEFYAISNETEGAVTIPSIANGYSVVEIGPYAFSNCTKITFMSIPQSVERIGSHAFIGCSSLQSFTFSDYVYDIGSGAFYGTQWYDNQPNGMVYAGKVLYSYKGEAPQNASLTVRAGTLGIANSVFFGLSNINTINIANSVKYIGTGAFEDCKNLVSVNLPESLVSLGEYAFYGCKSIKAIAIPDLLTTINDYTFGGCTNLTEVTIGKGLKSISLGSWQYGTDAFAGCENIKKLNVNCHTLEILPSSLKNNLEELVIGDNTEYIGYYTFYNYNSKLKKVVIGKSVRVVGGFTGCASLEEVILSEGNVSIENEAFCGCEKLSKITLPNTIKEIGAVAFSNCAFEAFTIPESVTGIEYGVFSGCHNLTSISIPQSINAIPDFFLSSTGLTSFEIPAHITRVGMGAFGECSKLESVTASENLSSIGRDAFMGVPWYNNQDDGLFYLGSVACGYHGEMPENTSIRLKDSTRGVASCAFAGQSNLTDIVFPEGMENLGDAAFQDCTGLTSIVIPEKLDNMGCEVFSGCTNLKRIEFHTTPTSCYNFIYCKNIKTIYAYMEKPREIWDMFGNDDDEEAGQDYVFNNATLFVPSEYRSAYEKQWGWSRFKNIQDMPNNIEFADENVKVLCVANWDTDGDGELSEAEAAAVSYLYSTFSYNTTITSFDELRYFTGLTDTGQSTFSGCTSLSSITLPEQLSTIGWRAFSGCKNIKSICLSASINNIGVEAFRGCTSLEIITIPGNKISFGSMSFEYCNSLTKVITDDIEAWMNMSFSYNGNPLTFAHHLYVGDEEVTNLVVPSSIEKIGYGTFEGCTGLKSVTIPSSVKMIDYAAFEGCTGLEKVIIDDLSAWCSMSWGSGDDPFSPLYYAHHLYLGENELTELVIPDGITSLGTYVFAGASGIVSVEIPESVTRIGSEAFCGCNNLVSVTVRNGTPIVFSDDTYAFTNRTNATLYVPYGCKAAYEAANYWKDFKEIVEIQPDLTEKEVLNVEALETKRGETVEMTINLTNTSEDLTAFQFDLTLPVGITLVKAENGKYQVSKTERFADDNQQLNVSLVTGNTYRVVCFSMEKDLIMGNEGALLNALLQVNENMEAGLYKGMIDNIVFTKKDGTQEKLNNAAFSIDVIEYITGDANGDGEVNVTDIVEMVNAIMEQPSERFIAEAADVNGDGEVNVSDIVLVVSMIMNEENNSARMADLAFDESTDSDMLAMERNGNNGVSLGLVNAGTYVAAQFDVNLNDGQRIEAVTMNGMRNNGHQVVYSQKERNTWRVMVYSLANETFMGNEGELLNIRVSGKAENIVVDDILFITGKLEERRFAPLGLGGQATGVSATLNDNGKMTNGKDVYDLQGRRVETSRSKSGLRIVNGKKMIVK